MTKVVQEIKLFEGYYSNIWNHARMIYFLPSIEFCLIKNDYFEDAKEVIPPSKSFWISFSFLVFSFALAINIEE